MRLSDVMFCVFGGAKNPLNRHEHLAALSACLQSLGFVSSNIRALDAWLDMRGDVAVWVVPLFDKTKNQTIHDCLEIYEALR